ncbi:MAG: hypothetical protein IRZ03_06785 [Acidobacterium ailaaui]|nr:hypothetical protein [Pseudacidobacterium ailaaui]
MKLSNDQSHGPTGREFRFLPSHPLLREGWRTASPGTIRAETIAIPAQFRPLHLRHSRY